MDEAMLWRLEEQFWKGDRQFFADHVADYGLMVFPEPAGVMDKAAILEAVSHGPRWEKVHFEDQRHVHPLKRTVILIYKVTADRGTDDSVYEAVVSSTYVDGEAGWVLVFHQQTPFEWPPLIAKELTDQILNMRT